MTREKELVSKVVKGNKQLFVVSYICYQIANLILIVSGLLISKIFAEYNDGDNSKIWGLICFLIVVLLSRILSVYINALQEAKVWFYAENTIRKTVFHELLSKPGANNNEKTNGDILNSFRVDIFQLCCYIYDKYVVVPTNIIFAIVAIAILFVTDIKLLIITVPTLVVITLLLRKAGKWIKKFHSANRLSTKRVSSNMGETFKNIEAIKLQGKEFSVLGHFRKLSLERTSAATKDNLLSGLLNALYKNSANMGIALTLLSIALVFKNTLKDLGVVTLFIYYMGFIANTIEYIGRYFINQKKASVAMENILSMVSDMELDPNNLTKFEQCEKHIGIHKLDYIECKDLSFDYDGLNVFQSVNLKLEKGEKIVIGGKFGSGKSTFIKVISGVLGNYNGEILWNGKSLENSVGYKENKRVTYIPQKNRFFNASIKENIILDRDVSDERIYEILKKVSLYDEVNEFEDGIGQIVGVNGVKLSGGQKQRLSLARALVAETDLLLIDDITSALDNETSKDIMELLFSLKDKALIIVSNRKEDLKRADRAYIMTEGCMKEYITRTV